MAHSYWSREDHWWMHPDIRRPDTLESMPVGTVIGFPVSPETPVLTVYEYATTEDGDYWLCDGTPEPINDNDLPAVLLWHPDMAGLT
jgi:hypothetical protein